MKITDDLFFYPWESYTQNNCNSILIDGPVRTLIDPGHKNIFPHLVEKLEADGFDAGGLDLVIYTHCHPDHMEAGEDVGRLNIKQALHQEDDAYIKQIGPDFYRAMGLEMPDLRVDVHLVEGELTLGDKKWQVFHTPGHSPGSVCLYWPEQQVLISGDLIFAQGVGRVDFPGGSGLKLMQSIRRMAELEISVVLPGHGPAIQGRDNVLRNFQIIERTYFSNL